MHQVEGWPTSKAVMAPAAKVWTNGAERRVSSMSLDRSLGDPFLGGSGLIATTGDVELAPETQTVFTRQPSPWSPLALASGTSVAVEIGYGTALARVFSGAVDGLSGAAGEPDSFGIVDDFDKLDQKITLDPLLASMPPKSDGGPYRHIGLSPTYVTSTILRRCGYYATPPARGTTALSVPLNGSTWAEFGEVETSSKLGDANSIPEFVPAPWGQGVVNVTARYLPSSAAPAGRPLEIRLSVGPAGSSGNTTIAGFWGADYVRVVVSASRQVYFDYLIGGVLQRPVNLSPAQMAGAEHVVLRATPAGVWSIVADNGQSASGNYPFTRSATPDYITFSTPATGTPVAGLLWGYHATTPPAFTRSAVLTPASFPASLEAMPAIVLRSASEVLREQATAELAALWVDDRGVVQWRNRFALVASNPVATLTAKRDLLGMPWEVPARTKAQKVTTTSRVPTPSIAIRATVNLWKGSGDSLGSKQVFQEVVGPGADTDWVMPDTSLEWLDATAERLAGFNFGRRSWIGAVKVAEGMDGKTETWLPGVDQQLEKLSPESFKYSITAPTLTSTEAVELRSHADDFSVFSQYRGGGLPEIRGYGKTTWAQVAVTIDAGAGAQAAEYVHDASWFVQHHTARQSLTEAVAARVNNPVPMLRSVPIIPDARIERGDIITIQDEVHTGVTLRCLVQGVHLSASNGEQDMSLDLRVLAVTGTSPTYGDLEKVWAGSAYAALESEWTVNTYAQFEAEPLRRA